jgi:hypothetical protein
LHGVYLFGAGVSNDKEMRLELRGVRVEAA